MKTVLSHTHLVLTVAVLASTLPLAAEKKIDRSALPPAVEKTVQAQTKGATIKGFATETEAGVFHYEVETILDGHSRDLAIAKDGTLLEVEEEVAMNALPQASRAPSPRGPVQPRSPRSSPLPRRTSWSPTRPPRSREPKRVRSR